MEGQGRDHILVRWEVKEHTRNYYIEIDFLHNKAKNIVQKEFCGKFAKFARTFTW